MPGDLEKDPPFGIDKNGEELRIYWVMYLDRESFRLASVTVTTREMQREAAAFFEEKNHLLPPVFEPVLMTARQFRELPEYNDFKDERPRGED